MSRSWRGSRRGHGRRRPRPRPDRAQPYAALGLTDAEYARIGEILGRRPDRRRAGHLLGDVERALLLQVLPPPPAPVRARRPRATDVLLAGIGENAGVVDIGQGYAVTFKIESHNHPSYVEPFQGAATGVGGIVRDILAMGARPIAVMDALRFGPPTPPTPGGCCPASSAASPSTATASACPTSAASWSSTPATPATRWSTRSASGVLRPGRPQAGRGHRPRQPGRPVRLPHRPGRHRRRLGAGQRLVRRRRRRGRQAAQRPGRRPVHGEAADRVLPGAVRRGPGRRHPGPRRGRAWPAPPPSWPPAASAAWPSRSTRCRCGTPRWARPRS